VSFEKKEKPNDFFVLVSRGGAQGIDENIFPAQMEIDWVYFYQRR
jgi:hypothetical protein